MQPSEPQEPSLSRMLKTLISMHLGKHVYFTLKCVSDQLLTHLCHTPILSTGRGKIQPQLREGHLLALGQWVIQGASEVTGL